MINQIDMFSNPNYKFTITLDQTDVVFRVRWNFKHKYWVLHISKDNTDIINGVKLLLNFNLFDAYKARLADIGISGKLYLFSLGEEGKQTIEFDDFKDNKVGMFYVS